MTHAELCKITAKRFTKKIALYEYKSSASFEEPDALVFDMGRTTLYEIKMSREDFKADFKKECRKKYKISYWAQPEHIKDEIMKRAYIRFRASNPELYLKQAPHLGNERYFVCESELLQPDEMPEGWGLYWYKNGRFYNKKDSANFRANLRTENDLLIHALRRYASGDETGIIVNKY